MSNDKVRLILIKYTIGASGYTYLRAVKTPQETLFNSGLNMFCIAWNYPRVPSTM